MDIDKGHLTWLWDRLSIAKRLFLSWKLLLTFASDREFYRYLKDYAVEELRACIEDIEI